MKRLYARKFAVLLAMILIVAVLLPVIALADDGTDPSGGAAVADSGAATDSAAIENAAVNGFTYQDNGSSIEITGYVGAGGAVTMPDTINGKDVTSIMMSAFKYNTKLTGIVISSKITSIPKNAFISCSKLASVTLPAGLTDIGEAAFGYTSSLKTIVLPDSVTTVGYDAFINSGLTSITVPVNVTSLNWSFIQCKSLASIDVSPDNKDYASDGGVLYSKDKKTLICCPAGKSGVFTVPGGVQTLDASAFNSCSKLSSVVISSTVKTVGDWAFCNCYGMKSIEIPANVTQWGVEVFKACTKLTGAYFDGAMPVMTTAEPYTAYIGAGVAASFKVYYHVSQESSWSAFTQTAKQPFCVVAVDPQNGSATFNEPHAITEGHIAAPAAPVWADHAFLGWYHESACSNAWDFATETVTGDVSVFAKWVYLPAPASLSALVASYNSVALAWGASADATGYEVWRAKSSSGKYTLVSTVPDTSATDMGLNAGTTYYYKVRSYYSNGSVKYYSAWSSKAPAKPVPAAPVGIGASPLTYNSISVTWGAVDGATKYAVYRATSPGGKYKLIGKTSSTSYTNRNVTTGTTYYYKVKAYHKNAYGAFSDVASTKTVLSVPAPVPSVASANSILISWGAVPGAVKYEVWACSTEDGAYTLLATTSAKSFLNKNLISGTYYYKVRAYRGGVYSEYSVPVSEELS